MISFIYDKWAKAIFLIKKFFCMKSNFILILCLDELRNAGDALKPLVKESNSQKKDNFYLLGISDVDPN